ncbi:MAG: hypothetical protein GY788_13290 [bacterium]|nr:hypothetical protein [bacterium]
MTLRRTRQLITVTETFIANHDLPMSAAQVVEATGIATSTVMPVLDRLTRIGVLTVTIPPPDPAVRRGARLWWMLNGDEGHERAEREILGGSSTPARPGR